MNLQWAEMPFPHLQKLPDGSHHQAVLLRALRNQAR